MTDLETRAWSDGPMVVGLAAHNGLGFNAHQTWAFRRAELVAHAESPFRCLNGFRATMCHVRTLPPRAYGAARLRAIAAAVLEELDPLLARFGSTPRVALLLGAPERWGDHATDHDRRERAVFDAALRDALAQKIAGATCRLYPSGHASLGPVLLEAARLLEADAVDLVLAGGIDTYYDPEVVEQLLADERLFDGENLDSIIPGEGAALLALTSSRLARSLRIRPLAEVASVATHVEVARPDNDAPNLGLALSRAARAATEPLRVGRRPLAVWFADVTNETFRTQEIQAAFPRVSQAIMDERSALDLLPQYLGELGAATMATGAVVAIEGLVRGERPGATAALLTGSSPGGARAAVLLYGA